MRPQDRFVPTFQSYVWNIVAIPDQQFSSGIAPPAHPLWNGTIVRSFIRHATRCVFPSGQMTRGMGTERM